MPPTMLTLSRGMLSPNRLFQKNFATSNVGFSVENWMWRLPLVALACAFPVGVNSQARVSYIGNSTKPERFLPSGEVRKMLASSMAIDDPVELRLVPSSALRFSLR